MKRARRVEATTDLNITSMMDMFTIILVFLLTFFDPTQSSSPSFTLAQVNTVGKEGEGLRLDVHLDGVYLQGARLAGLVEGRGEVDAAVQGALAGQDRAQPLVVAVDKRVPYETVAGVLEAASGAGFANYRFAVESLAY